MLANPITPMCSSNRSSRYTPWGKAQTAKTLADGITVFATARHGGIHLDRARQRAVKAAFPGFATFAGGPWYEEDQDWCIPALVFPECFGNVLAAVETARNAAKPWGGEDRSEQWVTVVAWLDSPAGEPTRDAANSLLKQESRRWQP